LEGIVAQVSGLCPEVTLLVETPGGAHTVVAEAATEFQRARCSQLSLGDRVHVSGRTQSGVYVAAIVRLQGPRPVGGDLEDSADADDAEDAGDAITPPVTPLPTAR
jgi:hypothetical protein